MSFTSHSPAESRNFDCVYDTSFTYPSVKDEMRAREEALRNACAEQYYPKYDMLFAATPRSSRLSFRRHENSPYKLDGTGGASMRSDASALAGCLKIFEGAIRLGGGANNPAERRVLNPIQSGVQCRGKNRNLYFFKPSTNVNVVNVKLSDTQIPQHKDQTQCNLNVDSSKRKKRISTRGTQTLYRESSAQTLPYTPNVTNDRKELETLELFKLPSLLPGDKPPGLYEVERLERARKRWLFAKCLRDNMRRQIKDAKAKLSAAVHCTELIAFEWERWIEREEELQECQMLRLELVIRMLDKREKQMHDISKASIEKATEQIQAKRSAGLRKNEVEYKRGMRRLEMKHGQKSRTWKKEDIIYELGHPASEAYAPQLRYGTNPRRRQFHGGQQAFNSRIGYLDKVIINMNNLTCPFSKIDKWAKPKGRVQEVEQRFCTDENLKKLYESLRSLRQSSDGQKIIPKCLIEKARPDKKTLFEPVAEFIHEPEQVVDKVEERQEEFVEDPRIAVADDWLRFSEQAQKQRERTEFLLSEVRQEELESLLADYEGTTIGWLMRFLTDEMDRLQELRKLHFITMLAQKERWRREAAEAGLRQKENEMRKVYEQLFYETNQANIEVCQDYLDDILMVDTYQYAEDQATEDVVNLSKLIDSDLQRWTKSWTDAGIQNPMNFDKLRYLLRDLVFPDVEALTRKAENEMIVNYIIEDVLFPHMAVTLDPYDIGSITANEVVDRLIDTDLYYFTSDCTSECDNCSECHCSISNQEAQSILRKVIRRAVPGRRWFTPIERLGHENVVDILENVVDQVEATREYHQDLCSNMCMLKSVKSRINLLENLEECKHQTEVTDTDGASQFQELHQLGEPTESDDRDDKQVSNAGVPSNKKLTYEDIITIEEIINRPRRKSDSSFSTDSSFEERVLKGDPETRSIDLRKIYSQFDIISHISHLYERDMVIHESSSTDLSETGLTIDGQTPQHYRDYQKAKKYIHYVVKDVVAKVVPSETGDSDDSVYMSDVSYLNRSVSGTLIKENDEEDDDDIHPATHAMTTVMKKVDENIPSTEISEVSLETIIEENVEQPAEENDEDILSVNPSELERLKSNQCKCRMELERESLIRCKLAKGKIKIRTLAPESLGEEESDFVSHASSMQELPNEEVVMEEEDVDMPDEPFAEEDYEYGGMMAIEEDLEHDLEPDLMAAYASADELPSSDSAQTAMGLTIEETPQPQPHLKEVQFETIAGVPTEIDAEETNTEMAEPQEPAADTETVDKGAEPAVEDNAIVEITVEPPTETEVATNAEENVTEENVAEENVAVENVAEDNVAEENAQ